MQNSVKENCHWQVLFYVKAVAVFSHSSLQKLSPLASSSFCLGSMRWKCVLKAWLLRERVLQCSSPLQLPTPREGNSAASCKTEGWDLKDNRKEPKTIFAFLFAFERASQVALVVKNWPANAGDVRDVGSIPALERSPGVRNGNQLQCSCMEISWTEGPGGLHPIGLQRIGHN